MLTPVSRIPAMLVKYFTGHSLVNWQRTKLIVPKGVDTIFGNESITFDEKNKRIVNAVQADDSEAAEPDV